MNAIYKKGRGNARRPMQVRSLFYFAIEPLRLKHHRSGTYLQMLALPLMVSYLGSRLTIIGESEMSSSN